RVEHGEQVRDERVLRVGLRIVRRAGAAVPAQVDADHGVLGGERREIAQAPPDRPGEHGAVQQHERGAGTGHVVAQVDPVDRGGDDGHERPSAGADGRADSTTILPEGGRTAREMPRERAPECSMRSCCCLASLSAILLRDRRLARWCSLLISGDPSLWPIVFLVIGTIGVLLFATTLTPVLDDRGAVTVRTRMAALVLLAAGMVAFGVTFVIIR